MADEDLDFGARLDDLRRARRKAASKLRAEGRSSREIASTLGVSHPTILLDLKESGPSLRQVGQSQKVARRQAVTARLLGTNKEDDE